MLDGVNTKDDCVPVDVDAGGGGVRPLDPPHAEITVAKTRIEKKRSRTKSPPANTPW
jgi:hypothetical protein